MLKRKENNSSLGVTIAETPLYLLRSALSSDTGNKTYVVINKEYGVVEIECYMLPQALKYLEELDTALVAAYDSYAPEEQTNIRLH